MYKISLLFILYLFYSVSSLDTTDIRIKIKEKPNSQLPVNVTEKVQLNTKTDFKSTGITPALLSGKPSFAPSSSKPEKANKTKFEIDWVNNQFLKDGEPFRYIAGEMHYFRIPREYWKDRLHKLKAAGANTVQTYIEWSQHEQSNRVYRFDGQYDVAHFIKLAQEEGLNVIIRPGPYICAEREFGGYPAWLLSINPNMKLRTSDPSHTYFVARWFRYLMPQIVPLLYGNGGPIIMVQVENEYGSYPTTDSKYLIWLRDLFRSYIKDDAVLFTTDGAGSSYLANGRIPGVFATVDFGTGSDMSAFAPLRKVQRNGPLVNSEFYVGWLTYWGQPFATVSTDSVLGTMVMMLQNNVSFSMYMFHGGTSFGFSAGSGSDKYFQADLTSYDYDSPITEAGDLTHKYYAIQQLLAEYESVDFDIKRLGVTKKGDYGTISLKPKISLFDSPTTNYPIMSEQALTFEQIDQKFGFVSYETEVTTLSMDPSVLQVNLRDRGIVYINDKEVSVLMYTVINETPLPPTLAPGQTLRILVENMGRRNYQLMSDCTKGIISNATIDGTLVKYWNITGYPMTTEDIEIINNVADGNNVKPPAYYTSTFKLPPGQDPADTYLDMTGWGKGVAFINGFNLGRYWHIGPQMTLYVPGVYLKAEPISNILTIFELHYTHPNLEVTFRTTPILNGSVTTKWTHNIYQSENKVNIL